MSASFCDLLQVHPVLEDTFLLHQEALLLLDVPAARDLLSRYRELIHLHMHHEESVVLPLFEPNQTVKWPATLYSGQHDKMRSHLCAIDERLAKLSDSHPDRRAVLALLDAEATYKHLEEHHDGAERQGLFPLCDAAIAESERDKVVPPLLAEWHNAHEQHAGPIALHREQLTARSRRLTG